MAVRDRGEEEVRACSLNRIDAYVSPQCLHLYNVALEYAEKLALPGENNAKGTYCIELRALGTNTILGRLYLVFTEDAGAVIQFVYVTPRCRGLGVGTRLVGEAVKLATLRGARYVLAVVIDAQQLHLSGLDTNPEAMRRILVKYGFTHQGDDIYVLQLTGQPK